MSTLPFMRRFCRESYSPPEAAYEKLKRRLAEEHEFNRDAYTEGKTRFVESVLKKTAVRPLAGRKKDLEDADHLESLE